MFPLDRPKFTRFAIIVLLFNLFIIVWGGFVSASGSGDGCGDSWPLCRQLTAGETTSIETIIEFTHRITSGLALIGVMAMAWWAKKLYPAQHKARQMASLSLFFIIVESLLGAGLVIFRWVDTNLSLARAIVQPIHLTNTFLLMAVIGLTVWFAHKEREINWQANQNSIRWVIITLLGIVLVSSFGTIASLASTIFPSDSFLEGIQKDFSKDVHYLIRLRIWHPIFATLVGGYLYWMGRIFEERYEDVTLYQTHRVILLLFWVQFGMGALNAVWLAPLWLQLVHLTGAHLLWLGLITLGAMVVAQPHPKTS